MASKKPTQSTSTPNSIYAVMIACALGVLALVGWAVSRSFNAPVSSSTIAAPSTPTVTSSRQPGSSTATADEESGKASVARISPEDLRQRLSRQEVTLIDVRNKESFDGGHIGGAMHIPLASVESYLSYVPRDKPIVTYCT